jgi:CBS domain-containing protein
MAVPFSTQPFVSLRQFERPVTCAAEGDSVVSVAQKLRDDRVGSVVVTRANKPVAIITDRDLALRVVGEGRSPDTTLARDVATYDPIVLPRTSGVEAAAEVIRRHGVRRVPIVDDNGALVGIVTADDLLVFLGRTMSLLCSGIDDASDDTDAR